MNRTIFWRLVWKEYRVQRAFFVAMALLAVAGEVVVRWASGLEGELVVRWVFLVGLGLAAFYALGVGATLFAAEHEAGTYEFQRSLPVKVTAILLGKTSFAVASVLAMLMLAWAVAWVVVGGQLPARGLHVQLWGLWGVGALEMLAWGTLFSLRLRQPLVAVILAVTCASTCAHFLAGANGGLPGLALYLAAVPARLMVVALVAAACTVLGLRWLEEPGRGGRGKVWSSARLDSRLIGPGPGVLTMLGRLLWQHARQSAGLMAALVIMILVGIVSLLAQARVPGMLGASLTHIMAKGEVAEVLGLGALFLAAPLAGAMVFRGDQAGHGFRFLAERGVRPGLVWVSRHLLWGTFVAAVAAPVAGWIAFRALIHRQQPESASLACGFVVLAYASGQLCSMFFHSGILAAAASLGLTAALCAWAALAAFLNLDWLWSVAPVPVAFLLTTWLWCPHWLLERGGWRPRMAACLPIAVVIAGILAAVPVARVQQIPEVTPPIDVVALTAPPRPEAQATVERYRLASRAWQPRAGKEDEQPPSADRLSASEAEYLARNQEALRLTMEACRRKEADFRTDPALPGKVSFSAHRLWDLLMTQAKKLELEGQFEWALDCYADALRMTVHLRCGTVGHGWLQTLENEGLERVMAWAMRPGQKAAHIARAVKTIPPILAAAPPPSQARARLYLWHAGILRGDPAALKHEQGIDPRTMWQLSLARWLPWERTRAIRWLDWCTTRDLEQIRAAERRLAQGEPILQDAAMGRDFGDREWRLAQSTLLSWIGFVQPLELTVQELGVTETRRRAAWIRLALVGWRLQHGELPDKLDRLVGVYFDRLPSDPFTGRPFEYFPKGFPFELRWSEPRSPAEKRLAANTPFLWSAGFRVRLASPQSTGASRYRLAGDAWGRSTTTEQEVWQAGWVFPISVPNR